MAAKIDDWILVSILLNNLYVKYKKYVHCLVTQLDDMPDSDRIVTLLHEEERLQKRHQKEQALAAKRNARPSESSRGDSTNRGGRNSGRGRENTGKSGLKISKNSNSSNYKGDEETPECPKCTAKDGKKKKRHWSFDC